MTPDEGRIKREQLASDGYCVVDKVLTDAFLDELRVETDRILDSVTHRPEWKYQGSNIHVHGKDNPIIQRLVEWGPAWDALHSMGLTDFTPHGGYIILSKPPGSPPLYWHQDWTQWNDPISLAPWPQYLFFSYYLVDTNLENGCMKAIPGTHHKRHELHAHLDVAHQTTAYHAEVSDPAMFGNPADSVDLPVKAGSLVFGEGRVLHAARANNSDQRRTLVLGWHNRPPTVPDYWTGPVPEAILTRPADAVYAHTRSPGEYLV